MSGYITDIFDNNGPIAKTLPGYELRPEQIEMAGAVNEAILNSQKLIVEAGTGVGKSFSYLVPAAQHVLRTDQVVIVSTNTINLQEQIVHKDIPLLQKALGQEIKAVLIKGRRNYLCLRRLRRSNVNQKDLFADEYEMRQFAKIVAWSYTTKDGSLYDLDQEPDPKVWDMLSANVENCLGKICPYYKKCFFQIDRERIKDARILIVNHHLFFSDFAIEEEQRGVLPEWDILVFDEAHSIENVATEHLGISVSSSGIKYLMDLLFNLRKQKGLLLTIASGDCIEWVELVRKDSDRFFKGVKDYFQAKAPYGESDSLRIRNPNFVDNKLSTVLLGLVESLIDVKRKATSKEDELEISSFVKKINAINNSIEIILNQGLENYVYWIESTKNKTSINAAPINIADILREGHFNTSKPIILTSATLSVDGTFEYLKQRLGIEDVRELRLGSSFDYKNQVRMYIARDMPLPDNLTLYAEAASERIKRYLELTNGSAFVLFTSYSLMNSVYEELKDYLNERNFRVLRQGTGLGRSKMISKFKRDVGSVLFGVDSFWQGIDVQGQALSNVIITKLPFAVPDHPIIEARIEDLQRKGKDAFLEYNLPEAVLRFKQGFGRLIRSRKDTGIIAILDSRIINKSYGRQFLNSIPRCKIIIEK